MPLPNSMVIFGDSNIATVRRAQDAGLLGFLSAPPEFWGAAGPAYRQLDYRDGALRALGPAGQAAVLAINEAGRLALRPDDFETFVFYGGRLRLAEFFAAYLAVLTDPERAVSAAALAYAAAQFLSERRAVRWARQLKADGADTVVFVAAGFPCWGVVDQEAEGGLLHAAPQLREAPVEARARLWQALEGAFADLGLELVAQPEETVMEGMFTRPEFAIEGAVQKQDAIHKAPSYAALVLEKRFGGQKAP